MTFWYDGTPFEAASLAFSSALINGEVNGKLNGELNGEGLRFGASVFTTLRVHGSSLDHPSTQWQAHRDRLAHSIQAFSWQRPSWTDIYKGCELLKERYSVLRIAIFPNGKEWITGRSLPPNLSQNQKTGIACWAAPAEYARSLPTHKTGNYLACWLARQQAQNHNAQEAILTSPNGEWLETATGNLWGWAKGEWFTPMSSQCLPGIMRNRIQEILMASGQPVETQAWDLERVMGFEAIAYSNCVVQLMPIHTILTETTKLEYDPNHDAVSALQHQLILCK